MRDDRLAIVVSPATSGLRSGQGELDADAIKERFQLEDTAFQVVSLDPSNDVAEQLDTLFDAQTAAEQSVVFYASCEVKKAGDEVFLCLDPSSPDTGDSLHDVTEVVCDRAKGSILFVIDARYDGTLGDIYGAEIAQAARRVLKGLEDDVELLIGVRPSSPDDQANSISPFTRALLGVLDEADPEMGVTAEQVRDTLTEDPTVLAAIRAFSHLPAEGSFLIIPGSASATVEEAPESITRVREPAPAASTAHDSTPPESVTAVSAGNDAPRSSADPAPRSSGAAPTPIAVLDAAPPPVADAAPVPVPAHEGSTLALDGADLPTDSLKQPSEAPPAETPESKEVEKRSFFPPAAPDLDALIEEARLASRARDFERALTLYRKVLGLGNVSREVRGHVYLRMGSVKAAQSKSAEAIANFEKALTLVAEGDAARVHEELLGLYLAEKDHRAALATQEKILKSLRDDAERFDALLRFGMSWLALPNDAGPSSGPNPMHLRARQMLERAERIQPDHRDLLVMLKHLGEAEGRVEEVLTLRERIADATTDAKERGELLAGLAKDLAKRGRDDEAVTLYERALDAFPSGLEPLVGIAEILSEKQEWSVLEASYRKMLARLPSVEPESVREHVAWELERRLGLLLRDHLDDAPGALKAFQAAVHAKPEDAHVRKLAADAARVVGDTEALEDQLLALVRLDPRDARLYHMLFDLFFKAGEIERACAAAAVLLALGAAQDRERAVYDAERADGGGKITTTLDDEMWALLRHRDLKVGPVDRIFDATAPAVAASLAEIVARTQAGRLPDPKLRVDLATTTLSAVRALSFAARSLGIEPPAVYLDDAFAGGYAVLLADPPASRVGAGALRGRNLPDLIALAGRHLTYHAPQFRLLALCGAIEDLSACFLAVVSLVKKDVKAAPAVMRVIQELAPRIETWLGEDDAKELERGVQEFTEAGGRIDLRQYIASVERTSLRAGLLLSGDFTVAKAMASEALFQGGYRDVLTADERLDELFAFSVSREYAELRERTTREG